MVFKVLRVMLRSFQEMCTILSLRKANTSETKVSSRKQTFLNLRQHSQTQMSSENVLKPKQKIEIGKTQDKVLQILNSDINSKAKESSFSPYRPLPEIGDGSSVKPKITRQLTYNVLNPVFVKGPIDFNNFDSYNFKSNEKKKNYVPNTKGLHNYKDKGNKVFSKKVNNSKISVNKELVDATEKLKVVGESGNDQAFWIEF